MLKSIFRSNIVQTALGAVAWAYMVLTVKTARWEIIGAEKMEHYWKSEEGVLMAAWHSRIIPMTSFPCYLGKRWGKPFRPTAMIISMSRDGAFITKAAISMKLNPIRGSATNKKKMSKDKGGREAIKIAVKELKAGAIVTVTPDGPRGPRETAGLGPIRLAQLSGKPIVAWGVSIAPSKRLKSWDRFVIPGLFGKGAIVFSDPIAIPRRGDDDESRERLEKELRRCTRLADEMCGLEVLPLVDTPPPSDKTTATNTQTLAEQD